MAFSDVVFRGKVIASTGWHGQAIFAVSHSWKGNVSQQITVYNYYGCDGRFDVGREYVAFMSYEKGRGFVVAGACGGPTRDIEFAGYALSWLESNSLTTKILLLLTKSRVKVLGSLLFLSLVGSVLFKIFRGGH